MISYKDKCFCSYYKTCAKANQCARPLTEEIKNAAAIWWGSDKAPIAQYATKPDCHVRKTK